MEIYKIAQEKKLTQGELENIISNVGQRIDLFAGNCGTFAIGLAKFLNKIGNYSLKYIIYLDLHDATLNDNGELDVYHVILSVEGSTIDDFFDGHGSCSENDILAILHEYGHTSFDTVDIISISINDSRIESFIRNNTNYSINENLMLKILEEEYENYKNRQVS